jgi:hypothetical protein
MIERLSAGLLKEALIQRPLSERYLEGFFLVCGTGDSCEGGGERGGSELEKMTASG